MDRTVDLSLAKNERLQQIFNIIFTFAIFFLKLHIWVFLTLCAVTVQLTAAQNDTDSTRAGKGSSKVIDCKLSFN